jgi:HSP20 family protein
MLITQYNPFREIRDLENRLFGHGNVQKVQESVGTFTPNVNTREGEYAYHIDLDLPGVKKEDMSIDIKDNILTVSGERNFKEEVKEEDYYKVETNFGKFSRGFSLPENADLENIDASAQNGVLEVVIPKIAKPKNVTKVNIK